RGVSGPILDRFDLRLDIAAPDVDDQLSGPPGEPTAVVRRRVEQARARAAERGVSSNSERTPDARLPLAPLALDATSLLASWPREGRLTGRGLHRVRRLALTVADCTDHDGPVQLEHVALALQLRSVPEPFEQGAVA